MEDNEIFNSLILEQMGLVRFETESSNFKYSQIKYK